MTALLLAALSAAALAAQDDALRVEARETEQRVRGGAQERSERA